MKQCTISINTPRVILSRYQASTFQKVGDDRVNYCYYYFHSLKILAKINTSIKNSCENKYEHAVHSSPVWKKREESMTGQQGNGNF